MGSDVAGSARQGVPAGLAEIRSLGARLALPRPDASDAERLELIRALEDLTRSAAAAHAVLADEFDRSQRAAQQAEGVAADRVGAGVGDDLALAGKVSPARSSNRLACSRALTREMPQTLAALAAGVIDAAQAEIITRATACLSPEDRAVLDEQLTGRLAGLSTKQLRDTVTALVYELDPRALVRRAAKAAEDAYVSMRPAPDVMCVISAMLPAAQGVAVYAALKRHAELMRSSGDERSQGRIMADALYANVTGRDPVVLPDIDLSLVMTDATLMAGDTVAAFLEGYGPLPAQTARDLLTPSLPDEEDSSPAAEDVCLGTKGSTGPSPAAGDEPAPVDVCPDGPRCTSWSCTRRHGATPGSSPALGRAELSLVPPTPPRPPPTSEDVGAARVFVRRLYADHVTGEVFARDTRRRYFSAAQRALVVSRDRYCRTPWCGAPIRHIDHRVRHRDGGATDLANGQGLCQRCNQGRERARHAAVPPTLYLRPSAILPHLGNGGLGAGAAPPAGPTREAPPPGPTRGATPPGPTPAAPPSASES